MGVISVEYAPVSLINVFMKKVVVYKSVLGTSEEYSKKLAERIGGDVFQWYRMKRDDLVEYDLVVVCSGPYENWVPLAEFLQKDWDILKDKTVIILAVGEIPSEEGVHWKPQEKLPESIVEHLTFFELPGRLNPETAKEVKPENLDPIVEYIKGLDKKGE